MIHKHHVDWHIPPCYLHADASGRNDMLLIRGRELQRARRLPNELFIVRLGGVSANDVRASTGIDDEHIGLSNLVWFNHRNARFVGTLFQKPLHTRVDVLHIHVLRSWTSARVLAARGCGDYATTPIPRNSLCTFYHVYRGLISVFGCRDTTGVRRKTPRIPLRPPQPCRN